MPQTNAQLQAIVGRALIDADFRARLVADVRGTLAAESIELDTDSLSMIEDVVANPERVSNFNKAFDESFLARDAAA